MVREGLEVQRVGPRIHVRDVLLPPLVHLTEFTASLYARPFIDTIFQSRHSLCMVTVVKIFHISKMGISCGVCMGYSSYLVVPARRNENRPVSQACHQA